MNTHTPKPWRVVRLAGRTGYLLYSPDVISEDQANANRALIESAPEMLSALRDSLRLLDETYEACFTGGKFWRDYPLVQGNVRAAIKIAESV